MKYRFLYWCEYCINEDPYGCFDGGKETDDRWFSTPRKAREAAVEYIGDAPWGYEIVDENGIVIVKEEI